MHHGTVFGAVDLLAGKHRVALLLKPALACQRLQQRFSVRINQVFGQIRKDMRRILAEIFKALPVLRKGLTDIEVPAAGVIAGL